MDRPGHGYRHRLQDDLISLLIKIMGDTPTDGQTRTRIQTQTAR
jgi:hypothetical protein